MRNIAGFVLSMLMAVVFQQCGSPESNVSKGPSQADEGKELFSINCASCHALNLDLTGPALAGVETRWPDKQKLYAYIRNSQAVIAEDKYAKDLYEKWNKTLMTPFPNLTDQQIDLIMGYIKTAAQPVK